MPARHCIRVTTTSYFLAPLSAGFLALLSATGAVGLAPTGAAFAASAFLFAAGGILTVVGECRGTSVCRQEDR